jgi:hypothetical protein
MVKGLRSAQQVEFESGRAPLVRAWDSRGFTLSPGPTKYAFWGWGFLESKKKKNNTKNSNFGLPGPEHGSLPFC